MVILREIYTKASNAFDTLLIENQLGRRASNCARNILCDPWWTSPGEISSLPPGNPPLRPCIIQM